MKNYWTLARTRAIAYVNIAEMHIKLLKRITLQSEACVFSSRPIDKIEMARRLILRVFSVQQCVF